MDYIKELQKLRTELLEAPNTNEKSSVYKVLAYKRALEDFKNKEEKSFLSKVLGDSIKKYDIEDTEEHLRIEPLLISRALGLNWHNLSDKEKLNLIRAEKRNNKSIDEMIEIYKEKISNNLEIETVGNRKTYITKL